MQCPRRVRLCLRVAFSSLLFLSQAIRSVATPSRCWAAPIAAVACQVYAAARSGLSLPQPMPSAPFVAAARRRHALPLRRSATQCHSHSNLRCAFATPRLALPQPCCVPRSPCKPCTSWPSHCVALLSLCGGQHSAPSPCMVLLSRSVALHTSPQRSLPSHRPSELRFAVAKQRHAMP